MSDPNQHPVPSEATASRLHRRLERAEAQLAAGMADAAAANLEEALRIAPDHVPTLLRLAGLHLDARRHNHARALVLRATRGHLESPKVALHLMTLLTELSETGLVVEIAKQLPPELWDSAKSLAELAQQLSLINSQDLARRYASAGVTRDPGHPPSLYLLASTELFFGELAAAAEHAERCLERLPGDPSSLWLLSRLRLPESERRIARIEAELARVDGAENEAWLAYALHNELHDVKDHERAWQALERACRAKRSTLDYDERENAALFAALQSWTAAEAHSEDGHSDPDLIPIFVIGLHRSGTTLAERILSGHSRVSAGGETYDIRAQLRRGSGFHFAGELERRIVDARAAFDYRRLGAGYLAGMRWRAGGKTYVTDKLPSNYLNVGFIARALPHARFIHLRRDPVDVGLSSLRTLFSLACPYSYDQLEFTNYYHRYRRLMAHWHEILPGRILDVDYDRLVSEPEAMATEMARFCGLDYEPGMVRIESRTDAVSTASSVMMRDGIRRDRGKVWKAYERQLQPMIEALASQ